MRSLLFVVSLLSALAAACGGTTATIEDAPGGGDATRGTSVDGGARSKSAGDGGATGCPTQATPPSNVGDGPPPPPRAAVVFDVRNESAQTIYVVNDDGEREMLAIAKGGAALRLSLPATSTCGTSTLPLHPTRFLFAVPPGATRTAARWDKTYLTGAGKLCVVCANQGRPELGIDFVDQYTSVDAAPGAYTAKLSVLTSLPAGCAPASDGFHCPSWPGASALTARIRTETASVPVREDGPNASEEHVVVTF